MQSANDSHHPWSHRRIEAKCPKNALAMLPLYGRPGKEAHSSLVQQRVLNLRDGIHAKQPISAVALQNILSPQVLLDRIRAIKIQGPAVVDDLRQNGKTAERDRCA